VSSQAAYVNKITAGEKDQLLGIEREAKKLNDAALQNLGDATKAAPPANFGTHPVAAADEEMRKTMQEDSVLGRIYGGQPELYSRLYAGHLGTSTYTADAAVVHRDLQRTTDLGSKLDILRNTPMDPIRKIELLQELRGANNLGVDIGEALATATRLEAQRGYGSAGHRVGGSSGQNGSKYGGPAPAMAPLSGNRPSKFIVG